MTKYPLEINFIRLFIIFSKFLRTMKDVQMNLSKLTDHCPFILGLVVEELLNNRASPSFSPTCKFPLNLLRSVMRPYSLSLCVYVCL